MQVLADRYELGEPVGAGGMARVLQARDRLLERPVAVKLLRDDIASDPEIRDRFLREARTAAQFNHPNAVAVFDSGDHDGDPWIVMEMVQGEDLNQRIRRTGPLEEADAVRIADSVLAALEAAHRQGLVHRDVKPANIMLLDEGTVKLADFGIAKSIQDASSSITRTGQVIGTARYLSPEQVSGERTTTASDVYAMGIVLYEMLAGQAPYTGSDPISVAVAHTHEPVPDVASALPHVSADVAAVMTRALAKDPADRYADAGAMRHALLGETRPQPLGEAAGTTAVLSRPAPARRRRPWLVLALLGLALLTAAALLAASGDDAPPEITTDTGAAAEEEPAEGADDAEADDPPAGNTGGDVKAPPPGKTKADHGAKGEAKGKGKNNGKAKGKGKKD